MGMLVRRFPVLLGAAALVFSASACKPLVTVEFRHGEASPAPADSDGISPVTDVPAAVKAMFPAGQAPTYRLQTADLDLWFPDRPVMSTYVYPDGSTEESYRSDENGYTVFVERGVAAGYTPARLASDFARSDDSLRDVVRESSDYSTWHGLTRLDAQYSSLCEDDSPCRDQFVVIQEGSAMLVVEWFGWGSSSFPDQLMTGIAESASVHFTDAGRATGGIPDAAGA